MEKQTITVATIVNSPVEKVWEFWTKPEHITKWNQASEDWHTPKAENDLKINGKFKYTMAAKDGSMSFDFEGTYTNVQEHKLIEYEIADNRKVSILFFKQDSLTNIIETFEAENTHPVEMQRNGWQSIMDNFKKYAESIYSNPQITPCLWFDSQAEEAANFYIKIFKNSKIDTISRYTALNGGPIFKFTEAISFQILCETQEEIDYYWDNLSKDGEEVQCGWLKDKFGISWQIVPTILGKLLKDPAKAERVTKAFLQMKKFDIEKLLNV